MARTSRVQVVPMFQAIVNEESEPVMTWAFNDATTLCERYGHGAVDLKTQLVQIHKDYAAGMEKAHHQV